MTQEDKLKKIIEKAVENGYKVSKAEEDFETTIKSVDNTPYVSHKSIAVEEGTLQEYEVIIAYQQIIFDHSFAKAIWGERKDHLCKTCNGPLIVGTDPYIVGWQAHLQQAVISDNPIDYYYENM